MKRYASSLDMVAKNVPWLIVAIGVWIVRKEYLSIHAFTSGAVKFPAALFTFILGFSYVYKTKSIVIDDQGIIIERKANNLIINFADIRSVKKMDEMTFAIRTFGNGGVFGYTGMYYKKGIGSMRWYATQRKNYILIEKTNDKKIVITPDEPDAFINDLAGRKPLLVGVA